MIVTKKLLNSSNVIYIGFIPISSEDCKNESMNITKQQIENIMFPEVLSNLQYEFKSWNEKLYRLRPKSMFRLAKLGVLPSIFLDLKDYVPLCESCMFGTSRKNQLITNGNKSGSIRNETDNKPGYGVSVDQIQSD